MLNNKDSIFIAKQTGIDGICTINDPILTQYLAANPTGVIKVKVKAHNYLPDSATVGIITGITRTTRNAPFTARVVAQNGMNLQIRYFLDKSGPVKASLFNAQGALVKVALNMIKTKGSYVDMVPLDGLSSGIYYCAFSHGGTRSSVKFYIIK